MTGYLLWLSISVAMWVARSWLSRQFKRYFVCITIKYMDGTRILKIIHVTIARFFFYKNTLYIVFEYVLL